MPTQAINTIKQRFSELAELAPNQPELHLVGQAWTEPELAAFEAEHGVTLPAGYREYLRAVGDGGAGFPHHGKCCGGLFALRDAALAPDLGKPFPLSEPWDEGDAAADLDQGCLTLGLDGSHHRLLLVVCGEHAGQVWVDSRGYEFGGLSPAGESFLQAMTRWQEARLADLRARKHAREAAQTLTVTQIKKELSAAERHKQLKGMIWDQHKLPREQWTREPLRRMALASQRDADSKLRCQLALIMAEAWPDLRKITDRALAGFAKKKPDLGPVHTLWLTHSTLARVGCALGGDGELADAGHALNGFPEDVRYMPTEATQARGIFAKLPTPVLRGFVEHAHPLVVPTLLDKLDPRDLADLSPALAAAAVRGADWITDRQHDPAPFVSGHLALLKIIGASEHASAARPYLRALHALPHRDLSEASGRVLG